MYMYRIAIIAAILYAFGSAPQALAATVHAQTSVSVHTGGIVAGAGEEVTSDDGSASASVRTVISSDESGGTADMTITTERDGVAQTESRHVDILAGTDVSISVATTAKALGASVVAPSARSTATTGDPLSARLNVGADLPTGNWLTQMYVSVRSFISGIFAAFSFGG